MNLKNACFCCLFCLHHGISFDISYRGFECILIEEACIDKTPERQAQVFALFKDYLYQTITMDELFQQQLRGGETAVPGPDDGKYK